MNLAESRGGGRKYTLAVFAIVFLLSALPAQAALYAPGETLDPACAPTDLNCGVQTVVGTGTTGQVPYYAGNGATLTATSSITILSNGNIGVGTTTPHSVFAISNSASTPINTPLFTIASTTVGTATSTLFTVLASGNVGIGTTTAGRSLEINGSIRLANNTNLYQYSSTGAEARIIGLTSADQLFIAKDNNVSSIVLGATSQATNVGLGTTTPWGLLSVNPNGITGPAFVVGSSTATRFIVTNGGNVGVGTPNPGQKLEISDASSPTMSIVDTSTNNTLLLRSFDTQSVIGTYSNTTFSLFSNSLERVTVTNTGNVGIGTTSPAGKLSIETSTNNDGIYLKGASSAANAKLRLYNDAGVYSEFFTVRSASPDDAGKLFLNVNSGTTAMVVNTSGNVGIGTTSPYAKLSVVGQTVAEYFTATSTTATSTLHGNSYGSDGIALGDSDKVYSPDNFTLYDTTSSINRFQFSTHNVYNVRTGGEHRFQINGSQKVVIDTNGNLGVATTSPWRKFSVTGTVALDGLTSSATGNALCITTAKDITDAGGGTCTPSSERFKEHIETLGEGFALEELNRLRVVSFDYKSGFYSPEDAPGSYGLIAEEVEQIDPLLVDYGYDGKPLTLKFEKLLGLAIQAIQELSKTIAGFAQSFTSQHIKAGQDFCIGSTCVTESQLQKLLQDSGQQSETVSNSPPISGGEAEVPDVASSTEEAVVPEVPAPQEPVEEISPTETPVDEPTPDAPAPTP